MNEPIINPWIFYIAQVCGDIKDILAVSMCASMAALIFLVTKCCFDEKQEPVRKMLVPAFIIMALSCFGFIFTPSKETAIQMTAAYYVTPANIDAAQGNAVSFVEELAKAIAKGIAEGKDGNGGCSNDEVPHG